jgi:SAM-dependent methyltransferase
MLNDRLKRNAVVEYFGISLCDLPTQDKIPVIKNLMTKGDGGLAVDIGIGTGFTTYSVFGDRPNVCVDIYAPNLVYYREKATLVGSSHLPMCVVALATALPFKANVFQTALCSEVFEHLEDDDGAARELARVLAQGGKVVVTVPHDRGGFSTLLEFFRIRTVHDLPGPEHHFRVGYTEESLRNLLGRYGLQIERRCYSLRFFTRLVTDLVSLGHLMIQKVFYRRAAWNWAEVAELESNVVFRFYSRLFPLVWLVTRLDKLLFWTRGFGLVISARKGV